MPIYQILLLFYLVPVFLNRNIANFLIKNEYYLRDMKYEPGYPAFIFSFMPVFNIFFMSIYFGLFLNCLYVSKNFKDNFVVKMFRQIILKIIYYFILK
jgi:hypothetical protein